MFAVITFSLNKFNFKTLIFLDREVLKKNRAFPPLLDHSKEINVEV